MCLYCNLKHREGWRSLLEYDDIYQQAMTEETTSQSTHGFHESWDDLKDELAL